MANETPKYIKRNSLISGLMLLPFVCALLANSLDKIIYNRTLYQSWLWHAPAIAFWVLWLPLLAALLSLITSAIYIAKRRKSENKNILKIALDIRQDWPLLLFAVIGLFILAAVFGHDSVHCITGNPIHEVQYWHQTWQCIQQGSTSFPFQHPLTFLQRAFGLN